MKQDATSVISVYDATYTLMLVMLIFYVIFYTKWDMCVHDFCIQIHRLLYYSIPIL